MSLAFEELDGMVRSTRRLSQVVTKIGEFLETMAHLSRQMGRRGTATQTKARVKLTLIQIQSLGEMLFQHEKSGVELLLLSLAGKYGANELSKTWGKDLEDGIRSLLIED